MLVQASNSYAFSASYSALQQNASAAVPDIISSVQNAVSATSLKTRGADLETAAATSASKEVGNISSVSKSYSLANPTDFSFNFDSFTNLEQATQVFTNLTDPQPLPPAPPITIVTKIDPKRPLKLPGYFKPTTSAIPFVQEIAVRQQKLSSSTNISAAPQPVPTRQKDKPLPGSGKGVLSSTNGVGSFDNKATGASSNANTGNMQLLLAPPAPIFSHTYYANQLTDDSGTANDCTTVSNSDCSFRSAINASTGDSHGSNPDLILLKSSQGLTLTYNVTMGQLPTLPNYIYVSTNTTLNCGTATNSAVISGTAVGPGLSISSHDYLTNLYIVNFTGDGLLLSGSSNSVTCFVSYGNSGNGITLGAAAQNNTIGGIYGSTDGSVFGFGGPEVIAVGNGGYGLVISGTTSSSNTVQNGGYGYDPVDGTTKPNNRSGILIAGGANNNSIGSNLITQTNLISNNVERGIWISGTNTINNKVWGNQIGTNTSGNQTWGNGLAGIQIDGGAANNQIGGDRLLGYGNLIVGNALTNTVSNRGGITILGSNSNSVQGNTIGVNRTFTTTLPNLTDGILLAGGAQSNTIGGRDDNTAHLGNIVSGNGGSGIHLQDNSTSNNNVFGNHIGTNALGTNALGNTYNGVLVGGGAANNLIGGPGPGQTNVIAGNGYSGISIYGNGTNNTTVQGNLIGVKGDQSGLLNNGLSSGSGTGGAYCAPAGNSPDTASEDCDGILVTSDSTTLSGPTGTLIGGDSSVTGNPGNLIAQHLSNNTVFPFYSGSGAGILLDFASGNVIQGNSIGAQISGTNVTAYSVTIGILLINGCSNNYIGGDTSTKQGNLVGAATNDDIEVFNDTFGEVGHPAGSTANNRVQGNALSVDWSGNTNANLTPNGGINGPVYGVSLISVYGSSQIFTNNLIGVDFSVSTPNLNQANLIGNNSIGILLYGDSITNTVISGNKIGVSADNSTSNSGNGTGIYLLGAPFNTTIQKNYIGSANVPDMVNSYGIALIAEVGSTSLIQNYIGTNASGSDLHNANGILLSGPYNPVFGPHSVVISQNVVAFNHLEGIAIGNDNTDDGTRQDTLTRNSIYHNGGRGINLSYTITNPTGILSGADNGPNNQAQRPTITAGSFISPTAKIYAAGTANPTSTIEIFLGTSQGVTSTQGITYLGTTTADSSGNFSMNGPLPLGFVVPARTNALLVATSTLNDPAFAGRQGSTSQFSPPFTATLGNGSNNPATIVATGGTPQTTFVNTAFANPLQVSVTDGNGIPVSGTVVIFNALGAGAGGTFLGSGVIATATTNVNGIATSPILYANSTRGTFTALASVAGVAIPANFLMTNNLAPIGPTLNLLPIAAGPNPISSTQFLSATLVDQNRQSLANATIAFNISGANNAKSGSATTDANGIAVFTYTGTLTGTDTIQATSTISNQPTAYSNLATVYWQSLLHQASNTSLFGRVYNGTGGRITNSKPALPPLFTEVFSSLIFNPVSGSQTVPGAPASIYYDTIPFTNVSTDINGNYVGAIPVQGNGYAALVNPLGGGGTPGFDMILTGYLVVSATGTLSFGLYNDNNMQLGLGANSSGGVPACMSGCIQTGGSSTTYLLNFPQLIFHDYGSTSFSINFPAAGLYPFEIDFAGDHAHDSLDILDTTSQHGLAPSVALAISPTNSPTAPLAQNLGNSQTIVITATDPAGQPVPNLWVSVNIRGANSSNILQTATDATGKATVTYTGKVTGLDTIQANSWIRGILAYSNQSGVQWSGTQSSSGAGGGSGPESGGCGATSPAYPIASPGWIGSPSLRSTVSGSVPIVLASGKTLVQTCVDYWPVSNPTVSAVSILVSDTVTHNGGATLTSLDTTLLANGSYIVRLRAKDNGGNYQDSETLVTIVGDNKPGRVSFTVNDLTVPVAGLPIVIGRTYDSLNRNTVGDFGNGWSLAIGSPRLEVNPAKDVTLTFPDGSRRTFYFTPQSFSGVLGFLQAPAYTAEAGLYGSLKSDGCGLIAPIGTAGYICFPGGTYQANTYFYTDPYGRVYTITAPDATHSTGTLLSVRDLNGNTLTFTPGGISSSLGLSVQFQRDAQNRITIITDTVGNAYHYGYDDATHGQAGDLTSITDPGIITPTLYEYYTSGTLAHFFKDDIDARGNHAATATYYTTGNNAGRLQSTVDATGSFTTNFNYNLATNTTYVTNPDSGVITNTYDTYGKLTNQTDPLGYSTVFTYDGNHNILYKADPLSHVISYTYDIKGNQTGVTNALGYTNSKSYNQYGGPSVITDTAGNTQNVGYDANFNLQNLTDGAGLLGGYTWDSHGSPLSQKDGNGKSTSFGYDQYGNVLTQTDALNNSTINTYDNMGRKLTATDPKGFQSQYQYDQLGHLTVITNAVGTSYQTVSSYNYDGVGNRITTTDGLHHPTAYIYDANNRLVRTTFADSTFITSTYDFRGNKSSERDQANHLTKYQYDLAGRLITTTTAYGTVDVSSTSTGYDAAGRVITNTNALGKVSLNVYDNANQLFQTIDPLNHSTIFTYDKRGLRTNMQDPDSNVVTYTYNVRSQLVKTTFPVSYQGVVIFTTQQYDLAGHVITSTDAMGHNTVYGYYSNGQLASVTNPMSQMTSYFYDADNNLQKLTDPNLHSLVFTYTALNQLLQKQWPDGSYESFDYDAAGNQLHHRLADSNIISYTYDSLNRPTQTSYFDGRTVNYGYTPNGLRQLVTDTVRSGTVPVSYSYDNQNRITGISQPNNLSVAYTYDAAGNRKTLQSKTGSTVVGNVSYNYYDDNRLQNVVDAQNSNATTSYQYDAAGNRQYLNLPNNWHVQYSYDALNRLTNINQYQGAAATNPTAAFTYTLDAAGIRTNLSEALNGASSNITWNYDPAYRLLSETRTGALAQTNSYSYDNNGNRQTWTSSTGGTITYAYNANDQIITTTAGSTVTSYQYDGRGNLKQSGTNSYTYNSADQLIAATVNGNTASYQYDQDGRRSQQSGTVGTTNYLWDETSAYGDVLLETNGSGAAQSSYVLGGSELLSQNKIGGTGISYLLHDGQGSTRALADGSGNLRSSELYTYDAFGNLISDQTNPATSYLYTGQQFDVLTSLYSLRARYYNPGDGKFLSRDTVSIDPGNPVELNRYSYAINNVINRIDPSGHFIETAARYSVSTKPENTIPLAFISLGVFSTLASLGILGAAVILSINIKDETDKNCRHHNFGQILDPPTFCLALGLNDPVGRDYVGELISQHPMLSRYEDVYRQDITNFVFKIWFLMSASREIHFNLEDLNPNFATSIVRFSFDRGFQPDTNNFTNYELCLVKKTFWYKTVIYNGDKAIGESFGYMDLRKTTPNCQF